MTYADKFNDYLTHSLSQVQYGALGFVNYGASLSIKKKIKNTCMIVY